MKIHIFKIAWSENKWKGMPEREEDYKKSYEYSDYKWVKENGIANEWWNFYEDFDKDYFYFRDPKSEGVKKIEDDDIVLLISRKDKERRQFVGVMGKCKTFHNEPKKITMDKLFKEEQINWIIKKNRNFPKIEEEKFSIIYEVASHKDFSFCLDEYIPYQKFEKELGDLRRHHYTTVKKEKYEKVIEMLEEAKKQNPKLQGKIENIINKIKDSLHTNESKSANNSELHSIINALESKPFLILAGISGTGKTQIARLIAEKWDKTDEINNSIDENTLILKEKFFKEPPDSSPEKVAFLPVKPDWNEPVKMWGFYNPLTGLFYPTDGLKVLLNAFRDYVLNKDENKKYFIILDEMNLARVEYYMSDLLSLMENMCKEEGDKIIIGETAMIHQLSRCVLSKLPQEKEEEKRKRRKKEKKEKKWEKYIKKENGEIKWKIEGEKLCMEECNNCPYKALKENKKEIDQVIKEARQEAHKALKENKKEQSSINEMEEFIKNFSPIPPRIAYPPNLVIIGTVNVDETTFSFAPKVLDRAWVKNLDEVHVEEYLSTCTDLGDKKNDNVFFKFVDTLIKILQPANLHFGYRVIHEMLKYLCAAKIITKEEKKFKISELTESGDFNFHLDFLLNSKVLPKIHGGEEKVEEILRKLLVYCYRDDYENGAQNLEKEKEPWWRKKLEEIKEIIQKYDKKAASETGTQPSTEDKQKKETSPQESEVSSPKNTCKFPKSAQKILEMYRRLKDTGYCSYF